MDRETEPIDRVKKEVWGMLYADDAGVVSKSLEGLTKMMTVIVTVFEAAGLTVSEKKTEIMLFRTPHQEPEQKPLVVEAAGQKNKQTNRFTYLGGVVDENANIDPEIERRIRCAWGENQKRSDVDRRPGAFTVQSYHG